MYYMYSEDYIWLAFIQLSCCSLRIMQKLLTDKKNMSAPSADMICGRPFSCRASQALEDKHFTYILVQTSYVLLLFFSSFPPD